MVVGQFHGILTGRSDRTWPNYGTSFFAHYYPGVRTLNSEYFALPLPRIEALRNRGRSRRLAAELIDLWCTVESEVEPGTKIPISLVSHSNGAVLTMQVAREIIAAGMPIEAIVMMAPALRTTAASREIADWLTRGMLDYALLVQPTRDVLISTIGRNWRTKLYAWPWGSLGSDGWDIAEVQDVFPNIPETIALPDMGHSDPVAPHNRAWLYESIICPALGLAPWGETMPKGEGGL
jgi:hypothetical protein